MISIFTRRTVVALVLVLALPFGLASATESNVDSAGLAMHGYDPVSYFRSEHPSRGVEKFSAIHDGARYLFSSAENRDRFIADPAHYAPQFGGYCSYGVRVGRKFDIDPEVYRVVDDKLYFQLNWGTQVVWLANMQENIDVAHTLWPIIKPKTDPELEAAAEKAASQSKN